MAKPTRISELNNAPGGPLASDQIPIARGAGASGQTYKVLANQLLTNFLSAVDTPTIDLDFNTSTGVLKADAKSTVLLASELNATDSSIIDLTWNAATKTLSANVNDSSITNAKIAFDGGAFAFRNKIINGDMRISQRGTTSFSYTITPGLNQYTLDRWIMNMFGVPRIQIIQDADAPDNFDYSLKATITTPTATSTPGANEYIIINQYLEGFNASDLNFGTSAASQITISFWVKSSIPGTYSAFLYDTDNSVVAQRNYVATYQINSANTWEKKIITLTGDVLGSFWRRDSGRHLGLSFTLCSGSTYQTSTLNSWFATGGSVKLASTTQTNLAQTNGATFYITGVQLEKGPTATPFEQRPIGLELSLCQRYYEKSYDLEVLPGTIDTSSNNGAELYEPNWVTTGTALNWYTFAYFKVIKRAAPTFAVYSPGSALINYLWDANTSTNRPAWPANANRRRGVVAPSASASSYVNVAGQTWFYTGGDYYYHWTADAEL